MVVLQHGHERPSHRQTDAVDGVAQNGFGFLFAAIEWFRSVPERHVPSLKIASVGTGGNLSVLLRTGQPYFQIVTVPRRKANVAAAQAHFAIRELQLLQAGFGVGCEQFVLFVRRFGRRNLDQFDFVKLVRPNQTFRIATVRSSLGTKAGRPRNVGQGQVVLFPNLIAVQIGHRNFSGGNQKCVLPIARVRRWRNGKQVLLKFR